MRYVTLKMMTVLHVLWTRANKTVLLNYMKCHGVP